MQDWSGKAKEIQPIDSSWRAQARHRLKEQTRPEGSLGRLEAAIEKLVAIQKKNSLSVKTKRILIFAADHGVSEEGVSLYPSEVTAAMVHNFLNGGATINALARKINAEVHVIDVGVSGDLKPHPHLIDAKIRRGTRNMTREPVMTEDELDCAMSIGWALVKQAKEDGVELLGLGEMGIGNTTAASAVISALTHRPVESVTGRGTGLDEEALKHKTDIIETSLKRHADSLTNPLSILRYVGGYEIAAMTGAILSGAFFGLPVVIDGWIVSASALSAARLNSTVLDFLFFAHQSQEKGHRVLLEEMEVSPLLDLGMRLGEASGAALAMGLLDAAAAIYNEVATFEEAGVARAHD